MAGQPVTSAPSLIRTLKAVGASFFGVRGSRAHQDDLRHLKPVHVILAGLFMAAVFVFSLILVVRMVSR
jgi:hypothetical protein